MVTGGAGYVGSHTCVELLKIGCDLTIIDNLSNSHIDSLKKVAEITGKQFRYSNVDLRNKVELREVFDEAKRKIDVVIHFAALKSIEESTQNPLLYYDNNVNGAVNLLQEMERHGCRRIVFSSSACVYGDSKSPLTENQQVGPTNAYGRTKLCVEDIIRDLTLSDSRWKAVVLRYFNPIGSHESGLLLDNPKGVPANLIPYLMQVGLGLRPHLNLYGTDYPTADGTGVRDYIHIEDLARGHISALGGLITGNAFTNKENYALFNLGTGVGTSVLEILNAFAKVARKSITVEPCDRRPGDVACVYADVSKAESVLGWKAEHNIEKMLQDAWNAASKNHK
jgi:UDP-glucose 4-epimerase